MANTPNYSLLKPDRTDNINDVDTSLANNFTIIDTEIKNRKDEIDGHIAGTNGQHTSEAILHADGSVKATLDNHESRLGSAETELTDHEGRLTDIETLGIDKLAPDLEGRLSTVENDVEGFLAPATMDGMSQQGYTFDEYRIGYVDNKLTPINEQLADKANKKKTDPWIDVMADYGAKGDGIADDTTSIQNAINNGGIIFFPSGTYKITSPLVIPSDPTVRFTLLVGSGMGVGKGATVLNFYNTTGCGISARGTSTNRKYFKIKDMQLENKSGANINGIELEYNTPGVIGDNVWIKGFYNNVLTYTNWTLTFKDVVSSYALQDGFSCDDSATINSIIFEGGVYQSSARYNIKLKGRNHSLTGVDFSGISNIKPQAGLYLNGVYGIAINGCYYEYPGTLGAIYGSVSYGIVINGLNISIWDVNDKLLNFISCHGITINGFSCESGALTIPITGSIGLYFDSCHSVTVNSPNIKRAEKGMYFKDTYGVVNTPEFQYCTNNIEFFNHAYVMLAIKMQSTYYWNCIIPTTAAQVVKFTFLDHYTNGSTAQRPTKPMKSQQYFDTSLGKTVWCKTQAVLDGSGNVTTAAVWVDATGTTV